MKATKSQRARMAKVKALPCVACRKLGLRGVQCGVTEVHHLLSGGRRRGHDHTVALGSYHHRGVLQPGLSLVVMNTVYGPSLRLASKKFHEQFGDDDSLLRETNELLTR